MNLFQQAQDASIELAQLDDNRINKVLCDIADAILANTDNILAANAKDLALKMGSIELPVRSRHGVDIANLPDIHSDPFDRMLITQARSDGLLLISHDEKVIAYGESVVKV